MTIEVMAEVPGVFYRAPAPDATPYAKEGASVESESIIGVIEVMKTMFEIQAGSTGRITAFCATDGATIEIGDVIATIDTLSP